MHHAGRGVRQGELCMRHEEHHSTPCMRHAATCVRHKPPYVRHAVSFSHEEHDAYRAPCCAMRACDG
eukprot:363910-Chlamydomonas_euryale.AAC.6